MNYTIYVRKTIALSPSCPKATKKPIAQRQNVDTIGFLNQDYLTASLSALPALNLILSGIELKLPKHFRQYAFE